MTEEEKRKRRCCLTGPSPGELKRPEDDIRVDLENAILEAVRQGCTTFVSGMTPGPEIWGAEIVIRLQDRFPELHLVAVIPFPGFDAEWPENWRARYHRLLSLSAYVRVIGGEPDRDLIRARNEWMVSRCSLVIAMGGESSDEVRETVRSAMRRRIPVRRLPA